MTGPGTWSDRDLACLVSLAHLDGIGPATLLRCVREDGPAVAWDAMVSGRAGRVGAFRDLVARQGVGVLGALRQAASGRDPGRDLAAQQAGGRHVLVIDGPGYPERLAQDPAPPAVLFAAGSPVAFEAPAVAIVGTRNATRAGRDLAVELGGDLARAGVSVVSGLALGIDGAAHRGALAAGPGSGLVIGVVGGGLDVVYPRRHADLYRDVSGRGLLVTEVPLGLRPLPWRFPARNRIIAGLADAVIVVESRATGGSMLTAGEALERGVPVLAVPGHPTVPAAAGTNELLFDGAAIVRDAADVLGVIGLDAAEAAARPGDTREPVPDLVPLWRLLGAEVLALAEVVERSGTPLEQVSTDLARLEVEGWVVRRDGWYEACRPDGRPR